MIDLMSMVSPETVRGALAAFWSEQLRIETRRDRLIIALPLMDAEGWQVVVSLVPLSGTHAMLTDRGETLARLDNAGLDVNADALSRLIDEKLATFELSRDGFELRREVRLPLQGIDVQIFGESLVSIGHLIYRHEPVQRRADHVYTQVRELLTRRGVRFSEGRQAVIAGHAEKEISVDFLIQERRKIACKTVERRGRVRDYMEQWGYRWLDAKRRDRSLIAAMFYDPDGQQWDDDSLSIGRDVCEIFQPYHEVDAITRDLDRYAAAA